MAGLLKQLQRNKPAGLSESRSAVVRSSLRDPAESPDALDEPEFLLSSGFDSRAGIKLDETGTHAPRRPDPRDPSISTALKALRPDSDAAPWWLTEEIKSNPQVETLVGAAIRGVDLSPLRGADEARRKAFVQQLLQCAGESIKDEIRVTRKTLEQAELELVGLLMGKGPLDALFEDPLVSEVYVDHHENVRVNRRGHAVETPFRFRSADEYRCFVSAILQSCGRMLSADHPVVDCVLEDRWRTRVNVVHGSLVDGSEARMCFRIPRAQPISFFDVLQTKTLPATVAAWLAELVALAEANILVLGPDGAGKTVMTTAMLSAVASDERVATIEEMPEIVVPNSHIEKLIVRPANGPDEPGVSAAELLRVAMRRSPRRLVIGEIQDDVSNLYLSALESGYAGSIATLLSETGEDGVWRLIDQVASHSRAPLQTIIRRVCRSIHVCVTMRRIDGTPCLWEIAELDLGNDGGVELTPVVQFAGVAKGRRQWQLCVRSSRWLHRLRQKGLNLMPGPSLLAPEEPFTADVTEE